MNDLSSLIVCSRSFGAVVEGDDDAADLLTASVTGDIPTLTTRLESPQGAAVAAESAARVYGGFEDSGDKPLRRVRVHKRLNLAFLVDQAASNGQATAVTTLLDFAARHAIPIDTIITGFTVNNALESNSTIAVFNALITANPAVSAWSLGHGVTPLSTAIRAGDADLVAWLVSHGVDPATTAPPVRGIGFGNSLLGAAANSRQRDVVDILLANRCPVTNSGALHIAALHGDVEMMRSLLASGANPHEPLPELQRGGTPKEVMATWTPFEFAVYSGSEAAVVLLRSMTIAE